MNEIASSPFCIRQPASAQQRDVLELALAFLPPEIRTAAAGRLEAMARRGEISLAGLFAAYRRDALCGAVWGTMHAGRSAVANSPQIIAEEPRDTGFLLLDALERYFREQGARFYQIQLNPHARRQAVLLQDAGLKHIGNLLFLSSSKEDFPVEPPQALKFEPYQEGQEHRLAAIVEKTYRASRDLPVLDGVRTMQEILEGYRHTGRHRSEFWRIVRLGDEDVGCLLLSEHPQHKQWELLYMGVIPEQRGRGWGLAITRYAQWLVRRAGGEQLVLAADACNEPALSIYAQTGFRLFERRTVLLKRLPGDAPPPAATPRDSVPRAASHYM